MENTHEMSNNLYCLIQTPYATHISAYIMIVCLCDCNDNCVLVDVNRHRWIDKIEIFFFFFD